MAKMKKGKKGKAKKKKSGEEIKTKKPTEKELFEGKMEELRRRLESANLDLERTQATVQRARESLHSEEDSASACVAHLKRALRSESDRRLERQERLLAERDAGALVERRALGKFAVSERKGGVAKRLFLQQKMELEGKLSLLEELRLARSSQMSRLQRTEESLREKTANLREKTREEDAERVRELLENREAFVRMCREVGSERREAFRLQIRVHAERQLQENVRLRQICENRTERLLEEQARSRSLKQERKSLELEQETLLLAERDTRSRKARMERKGCVLLEAFPDLRAALAKERRPQADGGMVKQEKEQSPTEDSAKINDMFDESRVSSEADERMSQKAVHEKGQSTSTEDKSKTNHVLDKSEVSPKTDEGMWKVTEQSSSEDSAKMNDILDGSWISSETHEGISQKTEQRQRHSAEDNAIGSRGATIRRRIESIRERELQHCLLEDRRREMNAILRDQAEYRTSLEDEVGQNMDRNGERMSTVLRASRVLQARCGKLELEGMDFDVLHQIRMILDG